MYFNTILSSWSYYLRGIGRNDLNAVLGDANNIHIIDYLQTTLNNQTVREVLGIELIAKIKAYLPKFDDLLPDHNARNLVHGDFDLANILVSKINGRPQITGILDWEFAFIGSSLWDVASSLRYAHKMPPKFKDAFINGLTENGLTLPNNWEATIKLINLVSLLDCLTRVDVNCKPNQCADIIDLIKNIIFRV